MVYLVIKELSNIANDVIMATSSLVKDMNDKVAAEIGYRANAIRALCAITDVSCFIFFYLYYLPLININNHHNRQHSFKESNGLLSKQL
jgi:hypothetical protein